MSFVVVRHPLKNETFNFLLNRADDSLLLSTVQQVIPNARGLSYVDANGLRMHLW